MFLLPNKNIKLLGNDENIQIYKTGFVWAENQLIKSLGKKNPFSDDKKSSNRY